MLQVRRREPPLARVPPEPGRRSWRVRRRRIRRCRRGRTGLLQGPSPLAVWYPTDRGRHADWPLASAVQPARTHLEELPPEHGRRSRRLRTAAGRLCVLLASLTRDQKADSNALAQTEDRPLAEVTAVRSCRVATPPLLRSVLILVPCRRSPGRCPRCVRRTGQDLLHLRWSRSP